MNINRIQINELITRLSAATDYSKAIEIIDDLNGKIIQYVHDSKKSVLCDIAEGIIKTVNFNELKLKLKDILKNVKQNKFIDITNIESIISKLENNIKEINLKQFTIDVIDDDLINTYFNTLDEDANADKLFKKIKMETKRIKKDLNEFEEKLCLYRQDVIPKLSSSMVDNLFDIHAYIASNVILNNKYVPNDIIVNKHKLKFYTSQQQYIKNSIINLLTK